MRNASLFSRLVALIIDSLIIALIAGLVGIFVGSEVAGIGTGFIVGLLYNWYFWTQNNGQTPAKSFLGIRVVSASGGKVSTLQAVLRYIGYYVNTFLLLLGWLWAIVDNENQGLHDKLASTRVVAA